MLTAALAAAPLTALGVLVLTGSVSVWPAILLAAVNSLAAAGFALLYQRQRDQLFSDVQRAAAGHTVIQQNGSGNIQRIIRALAQRSDDLAAERLRIEEAIVEALPDPLIILGFGPDHTARQRCCPCRLRGGDAVRAAPPRVAQCDRPGGGQRHAAGCRSEHPRAGHAGSPRRRVPHRRATGWPPVLSDRTRERALERMRADFVANASHELRTPLSSLIGFVDTLRGPAADDPPAQARFLQIMAEQGARMNRLIDDPAQPVAD